MHVRQLYIDFGVSIDGQSNGELIGTCPACGKSKHFYINANNGLHHCKVCGISGNPSTFLKKHCNMVDKKIVEVLDRYNLNGNCKSNHSNNRSSADLQEKFAEYSKIIEENPNKLRELAEIRKFKNTAKAVELMKKFSFGADCFGNFTITLFNTDGTVRGIQKYNPHGVIKSCCVSKDRETFTRYMKGGELVKSIMVKGSRTGFFGIQGALDGSVKIMVCEAPFKSLHLQISGFDGETELPNIGKILAIGIIGAGNLPKDQVEILRNRHIEFLYDGDKAGLEGVERDVKKIYNIARGIYNINPNCFARAGQLLEKYGKVDATDDFWVDGGSLDEFLDDRTRHIVCIKKPESNQQEQCQDTSNFTTHDEWSSHKTKEGNDTRYRTEAERGKGKRKRESSVRVGEFWTVEEGSPEAKLCLILLVQFLSGKGFYRFKPSPGDANYIYIRVENNIINEIQRHEIKDFLMDYLSQKIDLQKDEDEKEILKQVRRQAQARSGFVFSDWQMNALPYKSINFLKDTPDKCFLFFRNGFVEITKDSEKLHGYEELKKIGKYIWQKQIVDYDFTLVEKPSAFADFIRNTSSYTISDSEKTEEVLRGETHEKNGDKYVRMSDFYAKITSYGYLLHGYKDPANSKAIVCCDAHIADNQESEGGTGKSLYGAYSLSHVKNLLQIDGKSIDLSERFAFQQVGLDTQIITFDDAGKKFDFEGLFQRITGDFTVEGKNQKRFTIPFSDSPKVVITTNHALKGEGFSFERRQHVLEFSDYYKQKNPVSVHNETLFNWDNDDWNSFYSFVIFCIQTYLREGLITPRIRNYDVKKMHLVCSKDFCEWIEQSLILNKEYLRDDLLKNYKAATGDNDIKATNFTRLIQKWCKFKNYQFNPHTAGKRDLRNGVAYIKISK